MILLHWYFKQNAVIVDLFSNAPPLKESNPFPFEVVPSGNIINGYLFFVYVLIY